jgi:WD40 repeat protein
MSLLAPAAHATHVITISVAEVRDGAAFVKGTDAGRKQEILWEGGYVTTANGRGNFSFEGELPPNCPPDNCVGMLTAGDTTIDVPLAYQPGEPPELGLLELQSEQSAHGGDAVRAVGFAVDESTIRVVSGGADTHLRYWDLDLNVVADLDLPNIPYDIDVWIDDAVSTSIVASSEGGWNGHAGSETLRTWDGSGESLEETQAPIGFVYSVAFSPDNLWTIVSGFYGDLVLYRTGDLLMYSTTETRKKRTQALDVVSPDGLVASASTGGIHLWSFPEGCRLGDCELEPRLSLDHSGSWSFSVASTPDSTSASIKMASGTDSGKTKFWLIDDLATDPTVPVYSVDSGPVYALASSPDGTKIVAGENRDITVYDITDFTDPKILFRHVDAHAGRVNDVAFSPDSSMIVSGGGDGALKLWAFPPP